MDEFIGTSDGPMPSSFRVQVEPAPETTPELHIEVPITIQLRDGQGE